MPNDVQRFSWFDEIWPRLAVASGVGYVATAYIASRWLTRRSPAKLERLPKSQHCTVEPLECQTMDKITLKGWLLTPPRPRATIALFHGMRCNRSHMLERATFLTAAGYRCVAFDFRAHGESDGRTCSFGYHERHDVAAVLQLIRSRWPDEPRAALGVSMGAAAVCFAGEISRGFDALILESVYTELTRAFDQRIGTGLPRWLPFFRSGIVWFTERRLGEKISQVAPIAHIAQLTPRPVLLLTGSDDPHAPPEDVQSLADQVAGSARFHVIPGAAHENVCTQGGLAYQALLLAFLNDHLLRQQLPLAA